MGCRGAALYRFQTRGGQQILGHAHPEIADAVARQMREMPYTGDCHPLEIEWAEWLCRLFPAPKRVRFVGSGTEATMLALRLARAHSGRDKVLRIDGHFHGWHDMLLKGAKPGANTPPSLGIPTEVSDLTVVAPPSIEAIAATLEQDPEIGTLFVEASGANYGSVPLPEGFLPAIRALADKMGKVLVFDEVITGLRWSPGGRQARDGVVPDLTTLAKVVTGGLPGGAVVGRAEIMELLSPAETRDGLSPPVSHKGTFNAALWLLPGLSKRWRSCRRVTCSPMPTQWPPGCATGSTGSLQRKVFQRWPMETAQPATSISAEASIDGLDAAAIPPRTPPALVKGPAQWSAGSRGVDFMSFTSCVTGLAAYARADRRDHLDIFRRHHRGPDPTRES